METTNNTSVDYRKVIHEIWKRKKIFFIVIPATIIIASLYIICIPRTYTSSTEVAPESENQGGNSGSLGSLASTFGFDLSVLQSNDAITPLLYPDLMNDNNFVYQLFKIKVKNIDGTINTDYYTYLKKHQSYPWWTKSINSIKKTLPPNKTAVGKAINDPYHLPKADTDIMKEIRSNTKIKVDKKTGAITISTSSQDPMVCKITADSVREHLQKFITSYRTNKARKDVEYYRRLTTEAKAQYDRQRVIYGKYADSNADVFLESFKSKRDELENEMQLKYNTYTTFSNQLQAAIAKVQERTPAFTIIQGAEVPQKPTGPKRVLFVLSMTFVAFIGTSVYVLRDIILPRGNS